MLRERPAELIDLRDRAMRLLAVVAIALSLLCSAASAVTLEFWHAWPYADRTLQTLAYRYQRQTGVIVHLHALQPVSRMTWGPYGGPDLAGLYEPAKQDIEAMAARGLVQDIRVEISRGWYALFWPPLLETFTVPTTNGAGIYGVPLTGQVHVFVYNRNLFRKAGIGVPHSWGELMAAARKLRKIGITPYAGGFGSDMPPLAAVYEYSYLGQHLLMQTYLGHYPYTASQWIAYLKLYSEMRKYGFTTAAAARLSENDAARALLDGRVAMIFADTGFDAIRRNYKPGFTAWGTFEAPDDSRARFLSKLPGEVAEGLVINSRSPRRAQAIAFARWLTEYNQQLTLAEGTRSIPAMTVASNSAKLSPPLGAFALGMRDMAIDLRIYERPQVLATLYSGVRGILAGTSTPSATARRTQIAKAGH